MRTAAHLRVLAALTVIVAVTAACGASKASGSPTAAPSIAVGQSASPGRSESSSRPTVGADGPLVNAIVITVSAELRVRSLPRVSDDSVKYEPVLPLGTKLHVLEGPVLDSGFVWYKVQPVASPLSRVRASAGSRSPTTTARRGSRSPRSSRARLRNPRASLGESRSMRASRMTRCMSKGLASPTTRRDMCS